MCSEVSADGKDIVRLRNEFNFALKWSSKAEIKQQPYGRGLLIMCDDNGDDYM